jgi:hypothetical protein
MELLFIAVAFVAGGLTGYGLRAEVSKEVLALTADFKAEVTRLRADLGRLTSKL